MSLTLPVPEFSRPIQVDQLSAKVNRQTIEAEPRECEALAERLDLMELRSLVARLEIEPLSGKGLISVKGRLTANVVQACVVTLGPVESIIEEGFSLTFAPEESVGEAEGSELEIAWDQADPPDPIIGGLIDLGEVVVEYLALALDPFPRAVGAVFEPEPEPGEIADKKISPFAVLSQLRQKK